MRLLRFQVLCEKQCLHFSGHGTEGIWCCLWNFGEFVDLTAKSLRRELDLDIFFISIETTYINHKQQISCVLAWLMPDARLCDCAEIQESIANPTQEADKTQLNDPLSDSDPHCLNCNVETRFYQTKPFQSRRLSVQQPHLYQGEFP